MTPKGFKTMAPDMENRQEILRIRRILSTYLAQNISGSIPLSATSLGVPSEDTRVRRIPPDLSGLRKKYLEALQAHVKAREEYERVLQGSEEASLGAIRQEQHEIEREASASVTNHLDLLRAQRKYQKLRIIQHYLDLLAQKDAAKPDYLSMTSILKDMSPAPELPLNTSERQSHYGASESQNTAEALTLRLEKAVLRAQNSLENEKRLLAQVKSAQQSEASSKTSELFTRSAQIYALSQTRDELVSWIERRLAEGNQEDKPDQLPSPDRDQVPLEIDKRKKSIEIKYEEYLQARKSLLALASARRTPPPQETNTNQQFPDPHQKPRSQETGPREASVILPYLTSHLIPASNAQKGFLQQESYLAKTLADQDRETIKVLEKLADESHLLPTYPLLAAQPRFQHAVAALGSKPRRPAFSDDRDAANEPESQTITQARAWAFAASAARAAKHDEVQERLEHGETQVDIARAQISELNEILGGDVDQEEAESEEEDLWTESAGTKPRQKGAKKREIDGKGELGIWAGLNGNINIHDDRPETKS